MAIHSLLEQETVSPGALLFCDNQAAVATIGTGPSCDPDVAKIQRLAVEVQAALVWVPGHEGVPGNERADALAQGAADSGGRLVANKSEPAVLRRKIKEMTVCELATVQLASSSSHSGWRLPLDLCHMDYLPLAVSRSYGLNTKGASLKNFNTIPLGSKTKLYRGLTCLDASLIAQLQTNHIGLGAYLCGRRVPGSNAWDSSALEARLRAAKVLPDWRSMVSLKHVVNRADCAKPIAEFLRARFQQAGRFSDIAS
ncbi:uncharacterized protein SPSC_00899 [Sporisorium scitamineum]|uniref:RNase H type-1 domain-containing protein n=1 Tax=Sporisorium scitamineum TaxID=49012 RepID=A0A127Z806_9BASI|nr:uncharacterized protein SPSC_00899 [Sporisorium scitamineum]